MLHSVSRRAGLSLLVGSACAATVAVSGCGDGSTAASDASTVKASTPGAKLLDQAFSAKAQTTDTGESFSLDIKGSAASPRDKELQSLSGEIKLDVSLRPTEAGKAVPPLSLAFAVRGSDKDGQGKPGSGDYRGGVTYVGDQFYASWQGKDYAAGPELSSKALGAIQQQWKRQGISPTNPTGTVDSKKLAAALDLDPGSWLKSTTVSDGGTLDGVDTQKVTGPVDPKAFADDWTSGFRNMASVMPQMPGIDKLKQLKDISDKDIKDAEQALSVLDASVWIGAQDHEIRKIELQVKFDDKTGDAPSTGDFTIVITDSTKPTAFAAPKDPAPITDLFGQLEQQFGGPGGPLAGMLGGTKTA